MKTRVLIAIFLSMFTAISLAGVTPINLSSSVEDWDVILQGTKFDPGNDQQASANPSVDIIGTDQDATLLTIFDDKGTTATTDDVVAFRIRVGGANAQDGFGAYIWLGMDVDNDNDLDAYLNIFGDGKTGAQFDGEINIYDAGTGANTSPSTSSVSNPTLVSALADNDTNYTFLAVDGSTDPNASNTDLNGDADTDRFVSIEVDWTTLAAAINSKSLTGGGGSLISSINGGSGLTKDTAIRFTLSTSTNSNNVNSDAGGYDNKNDDLTVTYADQGAFSPPLSFSNILPVISSDNGEDAVSISIIEGTTAVTTVTATDANGDAITYSTPGGIDKGDFTIDETSGELTFSSPPDFDNPTDDDFNNIYVVQVAATDAKGGVDTQTITVTVNNSVSISAANSIIFTTSNNAAADGVSTNTVRVEVRDDNNNPVANTAVTVTLTDVGNATLGTIANATDTNGHIDIELTNGTAETLTIGITVNGVASGDTASVSFVAATADETTSTISATPGTLSADGTSTTTITVQLKDANGNSLTSGGDTVTLSSNAGTLGAVSDDGDGSYSATLTSATSTGTATITGTVNSQNITDTASVTFQPGTADAATSAVTSAAGTLSADGTSTTTITVQLKDANGNNLASGGDTVTLSSNAGTLGAVSDNGDGSYSATLTSATSTGTATITGTVNSQNITDTASVTFQPGTADAATSAVTSAAGTLSADGTSTTTITVQLKDANGNNLASGGDTVTLSSNAGTLGAVSDNGDGSYSATLTSATSTGTATITGTVNSQNITDTASVTFEPGTADAATSAVTSAAGTLSADGTSTTTITVQLKDANGNNLASGGDTVTLSSNAGTLGAVSDDGDGSYSATLTSATSAGTATITGTVNSQNITDTASVTFQPGTADAATSAVTSAAGTLSADGTSTTTITVQLKDANGNNLASGGDTVTLSSNAGTLGAVSDNGDGSYSATLTSATSTGTATITGTVNSQNITDTASVTFEPGTADAATSAVTSAAGTLSADGTSTTTITVQLKDANGNSLASGGDTVTLSSNAGTLGAVSDDGDGSYSATLTSATSTGTATITGTVNSQNITDTASVDFIASSVDATQTTITVDNTTVTADGSSSATITVQAKDSSGNDLTSSSGSVILTSAGNAVISAVSDHGDGTYSATITNTKAESVTLSGSIAGSAISDTATVTFVPGAADIATSTISATASSISADGTSTTTITVQLKDANGNNLSNGGDMVTLSSSAGTLGTVSDNGDGSYSATLTSATSTGTATITGTVNSQSITDTASVDFIASSVDATQTTITVDNTTVTADGSSSATITVQAKDSSGNDLTSSGGSVILTTTGNAVISAVSDHGDGTYSATITNTKAESVTLSGSIAGSAISDTATVTFVPGAADIATSTISATASSISADGTSTTTITVQLKDANGNNLTSGGDTVTLSSNAGTLGAVSDNGDGSYSATLTSATSTGTATITGTVNSQNITDTASVDFIASSVDATQTTITVDNTTVTADGSSSATITVQAKDSSGNDLTSSSGSVNLSTTGNAVVSAVSDHDDGTYSATVTDTKAESVTLSGSIAGSAISDTATVTFVPGAADATTSVITSAAGSMSADGTSTTSVIVQLKDANGNNLTGGGDTVTLSSSAGTLSAVSNNGDGTYSATLTSATSTGTATISGTVNGQSIIETATIDFVFGSPSAEDSIISTVANNAPADGVTANTVRIQVLDNTSTALTNYAVGATLTNTGSATMGEVNTTTDANGYIDISLTDTTEETLAVGFTLDGISGTTTTMVVFMFDSAGDSDNDGISNAAEGTMDNDGDGIPNHQDPDSDNDGIPDALEGDIDTDGDGIIDALDLDSDNDGLPDVFETNALGTDSDADGVDDAFDVDFTGGDDVDGDGIDDNIMQRDQDNDGIADYLDADSDGDGLPDALEAGLSGSDIDNDGIDDAMDADTTGGEDRNADGIDDAFLPQDTDNDGLIDVIDVDSDNDGISDRAESQATGEDSDGDGIEDAFDVDFTRGNDLNQDGVDDAVALRDTDADGVSDALDLDSDNDSILDVVEGGSLDANLDGLADPGQSLVELPADNDGDGLPDLIDVDSDNDGIFDIATTEFFALDQDDDGRIDTQFDTDSDGIMDVVDNNISSSDRDGDGIDDIADLDDDNDGISDIREGMGDTDGDGVADALDPDSDNDGINDWLEAGLPPFSLNDSDNDGIDDAFDVDSTAGLDSDGDGVDDRFHPVDSDGDGTVDLLDTDSDNDGISDTVEQLSVGASGNDSDSDGIDDAFDVDNSGGLDLDGDGIDDALVMLVDSDGDGLLDFRDPDSDGDGLADAIENGDYNDDGINDRLQKDPGLKTDLSGGGGSMDFGMLMVFVVLLVWRIANQRVAGQMLGLTAAALLLSFVYPGEPAFAQEAGCVRDVNGSEEWRSCWYLGGGLGYSKIEPDDSQSTWRVDDSSDSGYKVHVGYHFRPHWFAELSYADLGGATVNNRNPAITGSESVEYAVPALFGGYYLREPHKRWNLYGKVGLAVLDTEASASRVIIDELNGGQVAFGIGVQWRFGSRWLLRGEMERYDEDAQLFTLSLSRYFRTNKRAK